MSKGESIVQACRVYYFKIWRGRTKIEQGYPANSKAEAWQRAIAHAGDSTGVTRLAYAGSAPCQMKFRLTGPRTED